MFVASLNTLAPRLQIKLGKPIIVNTVFKLHYQITVTFLLLCGLVVCARELLGEHMKCLSEHGNTKDFGNWINNYCFFMATFTIKELYNETKVKNHEIPHPGVGHYTEKSTIIYHTYYQWVPFLLVAQTVCFYVPYCIWKRKEGGRIKALVEGLRYAAICGDEDLKLKALNIPSKKTLDKKLDIVKRDILLRLKVSRSWAVWLVAMEVTNLLHVCLQIWVVDRFLSGHFISLGPNIINFDDWANADVTPLSPIFPKVTKCVYYKYGASGQMENRDAICTMALNNVHEKIFTALWFWFLCLFIVSVAAVIWRGASFLLWRQSRRFSELMFQKASSAKLDPELVHRVVQGCYFGDCLFIYYLAKNMKAIAFEKLLKLVAQELENQEMEDSLGFKKIGFEPMMAAHNMGYDDEKKH